MSESDVQITSSGGTRMRTDTKSIGGNTKHQEYVLPGEHSLPAYTASAISVAANTVNDHIIQVMAGSSNPVRIRRVHVRQMAAAGAVAATALQLVRLTTAGTGGTSVTPRPLDSADSAAGATSQTVPTAKGTEGVVLWSRGWWLGTTALPVIDEWEWVQLETSKPIIIPSGTANGIAVKIVSGVATFTCSVSVEFVETTFV